MQPTSPNPDFDFMLKNNQLQKGRLPLSKLNKWAKIGLLAVAAITILIIVSSIISSRKGAGTKPLLTTIAQNAEILRVTQLTQSEFPLQDPSAKAVAATVSATLSSDQVQLTSYLSKNKIKLPKSQLAANTDKSTDTALQSALQNNNLDTVYINYLRDSLTEYQADLQTAYKSVGPNGKTIVKNAYESANTILSNPPIKG